MERSWETKVGVLDGSCRFAELLENGQREKKTLKGMGAGVRVRPVGMRELLVGCTLH